MLGFEPYFKKVVGQRRRGFARRRVQGNRGQLAAQKTLPEATISGGHQRTQACHALRDRLRRHRVFLSKLPCPGIGAGGKRKQVQVREGLGRNKGEAFFKESFALARKAHHHVGADRAASGMLSRIRRSFSA